MELKEWCARLNKVVNLFNDDQYSEAEKEARALLDCPLPRGHRIRCQLLLAQCVDDWYEAKVMVPTTCASDTVLTCQ